MLKRILSFCLLAVLCISLLAPAGASNAVPTAHGIDVSHHQGVIDWDTVATQIDFAILRCGYGSDLTSQDDRQWKANVEACTRLEIPFGVYIYSYAINEEQAYSEAQHVLRQLKGYQPSMPVYLDLEDASLSENCTPAQILHHATIFCNAIEAAGYTAGIYANTYWWTKYLTSSEYDKWDRWVARYASETGYHKPYSMWQYTSQGSVKGINGNVDLNRWYGEVPTVGCSHSYAAQLVQEASCTREGILRYTCSRCGDSYEQTLPAKGHSYQSSVQAPSCTQGGYTKHVCACGDSYSDSYTAALGHDWDEGTVTRPPTQTQTGQRVYSCSRCELTMTVILPILGTECEDCPSAAFTDVPPAGNWAHEGIDFALREGLFQGTDETLFEPEGNMTRAMLVTVLWRYVGRPEAKDVRFADVPMGLWYSEAVSWAAERGIVEGVGDGQFAPELEITREQLAVILHRFCSSLEVETQSRTELSTFPDCAQISDYAQEALSWAVAEGLLRGVQEDEAAYLMPQGSATRAQVATILQRLIEDQL